jgi:hypothetical protein
MNPETLRQQYPIRTLEVSKEATSLSSADAVIGFLKACIAEHPVARYIGEFDHLAHTHALAEHEVGEDITQAKHVLFCFGSKLPHPEVMAVRPRSIGVVEQGERLVLSYLITPMAPANEAMARWVEAAA